MAKANGEVVLGQVIELLPNATFRIQLKDKEIIGFLSGRMRVNKIKVIMGDIVQVELDKFGGKCTNRIIRRQ